MGQYLAAIIAFGAALVAVRGSTWDESKKGLARLTKTGRWVVGVAALGLVVSVVQTNLDHKRLAQQENIARAVAEVAAGELDDATSVLLRPFFELLIGANTDHTELRYPVNEQALRQRPVRSQCNWQRFFADPAYMDSTLKSPFVYWALGNLKTEERPIGVFNEYTWGRFFKVFADTSITLLDKAQERFYRYLDGETILAVGSLQVDPFLKDLRMVGGVMWLRADSVESDGFTRLSTPDSSDSASYEHFVDAVARVRRTALRILLTDSKLQESGNARVGQK